MRKILFIFAALVLVSTFAVQVSAAKPVDSCKYVTGGMIPYPAGHYLAANKFTTGYDIFGYNYQAHIFNGLYGNAYFGRDGWAPYAGDDTSYLNAYPSALGHWAWQFRNINLQMKWNDAWLANKDCNLLPGLDRPSDTGSYIGSGAWLTNHATGTYTSTEKYNWDVSGIWNFDVVSTVFPGTYAKTMSISQDASGNISGTGNNVPAGNTWGVTGKVNGDAITFSLAYDAPMAGYVADFIGTIGSGGVISGTWLDVSYGDTGTWNSTSGHAVQTYDTCTVSDFVKIIAPPTTAKKLSGVWYDSIGNEIGPDIWGEFAIIQEIASDPCGEYGVIDYMSPLRKGLGNWNR